MIFVIIGVGIILLLATTTVVTEGLGMKLSIQEIYQYAIDAGFSPQEAVTATAIAIAESNGNPNAKGDLTLAPNFGPSLGLWQINIGAKAHPEMAAWNLYDAGSNAAAARQIYIAAGYSFKPWSTYTGYWGGINHTPPYLSHIQQVQSEVSA